MELIDLVRASLWRKPDVVQAELIPAANDPELKPGDNTQPGTPSAAPSAQPGKKKKGN
ncbi:hypothetical protein [Dyella caseinilytica]|uniref:Uncharacterized protein n=1 Tax=Dyella caseinilytica TaxID=1849581 RepID=A0ABX7GQR1_9GAMM|nr:hypothetical protein [Dyella caseinilytica]QRN52396.1 hypothetical protein ISN74_13010 [Dyella caseinilytica]GGA05631.1 hypothetical protein GCM10011408_28190 [Dyella caseinilytica]